MAIERARFPQTTRIALLEDFERRTDAWRENTDLRIDRAESRLDVIGTKVGVYAAIGACVGAGLVSGVIAAFLHL